MRTPAASGFGACIVAVARTQDRAAFAVLFAHFAPRVKGYLLRSGIPEARAEELAQDALLQVWRKAALFDPGRAAASTWIFTIARNLRVDGLRRERRPPPGAAGGIEEGAVTGEAEAADVPDDARSAEDLLDAAQRQDRLWAALRTLPEPQARALELAYFGERSQSEVGRDLGVPLGTVKGRLRMALARLRAALDEDAP